MSNFLGKLFASLFLGLSSLIGGHSAPITIQSQVPETSTVSAATATPIQIETTPVVHPAPVKTVPSSVIPVQVITPVTTAAVRCASGKEYVDGACQWTASSTVAILQGQKNAELAPYQTEIQSWQADADTLKDAISNATQHLQEDQSEEAGLDSEIESACHFSTGLISGQLTTGTSPVAQGNAAISEESDNRGCDSEETVASNEKPPLESDEATLQTTITTDQAQQNNDENNIAFAQEQIQKIQNQ